MKPVPEDFAVLLDHNNRTRLLYAVGRTNLHMVGIDKIGQGPGVRLIEEPLIERRYMREMKYKGTAYPVPRAVRMLKRAGKTLGITDGAAAVLKELS